MITNPNKLPPSAYFSFSFIYLFFSHYIAFLNREGRIQISPSITLRALYNCITSSYELWKTRLD